MTPRSSSGRRSSMAGGSLLIALVLGVASPVGGNSNQQSERALVDSAIALDRAITALSGPQAEYGKVFHDLLHRLPPSSPSFLESDIVAFLNRAPKRGQDFPCSAEFLRHQAWK